MANVLEALHMARQALDSGDPSLAATIYTQIQQSAPGEPRSLLALAQLAQKNGDTAAVEDYARRAALAATAHPKDAAVHNVLTTIYLLLGRHDEAVESGRRAIELVPTAPELHNNLGAALSSQGDIDRALASFRKSADLRPNATAHHNLGKLLFKQEQLAAAAVEFQRAIDLDANHYEALVYLGVIHARTHALDEAEQVFRRAIEMQPQNYEAYNNLAAVLQPQGRLDEAVRCFDTAIRYCPDSAEAHFNRACIDLLHGDLTGGLPGYEWRLRTALEPPPPLPFPRWQGEPLDGRTLLLIFEQGLGDAIQFVRYATFIKRDHPQAKILILCPRSWHRLIGSVAGVDGCVFENAAALAADYYLPMASLPLLARTTLDSVPAEIPYLAAERERNELWKRELAAATHDPSVLKVGIAWQGNPKYPSDYYRSIRLAEFAPLAACKQVRLFSLQKNFGHEQLAEHATRLGIVDLGSRLDVGPDAMLDTAAVMANLGLVVTSDTSLAHLAGALGVPVWVALPLVPDWRWMLQRDDTPWYPTMRLFRQRAFCEWSEVFARVAAALDELTLQRQTR